MNPTEIIRKTDFNKFSLTFSDDAMERRYVSFRIKRNLNKIRVFYFVTLIIYCIYLMFNFFYYNIENDDGINVFYIKISLCAFLLLNGLIILTDFYEEYYLKITIFVKTLL